MKIIKTVMENGVLMPIEISALQDDEKQFQRRYKPTDSVARDRHRRNHTLPTLIERNEKKILKRQNEFAQLSGGLSALETCKLLPAYEYTIIKLYYGLENEIASGNALRTYLRKTDGSISSKQWVNKIKNQALKSIFVNKIQHIWGIPLFKLPSLMSDKEYQIMNLYWGLDSGLALATKAIATRLDIPFEDVLSTIERVERELARHKHKSAITKPVLTKR
jgi:hypothetical protein